MNETELHQFYVEFVARLRDRGMLCAITSGLACVHYGVAESTKDCDLLCHPAHFNALLQELSVTTVAGHACGYRGNLSPPLDDRWHCGGWTSHFNWGRGPDAVTLDVFGRALRASTPWPRELSAGLYISAHIVADMKRTNRDKDWPFITALGARMVRLGDPRGWLHVFELALVQELLNEGLQCPAEFAARRPALQFALAGNSRASAALLAERLFWEQLDLVRIKIYERALRPYMVAVRKLLVPETASLMESHRLRVRCAEAHLAASPLVDYGIERHIDEARQQTIEGSGLVKEAAEWLPDVRENFEYLTP